MSNFTFLEKEFPEIFSEVSIAEKYTFSEPKYAVLQCRIALEKTVNWLYDNDVELQRPEYQTTLNTLIYLPEFKNSLKPSMFNEINLIRKIGNNGVHGKTVSQRDALICLRGIFRFTSYLSKYYSEENPEISSFNEVFIPIPESKTPNRTAKQLEKVQLLADEHLKKLEKERKNLEESKKQNELLKLQLEKQNQQLLARKQARKQVIVEDVEIPELTPENETRKLYIDVLLQEAGWINLKKGHDIEFPVTGMPKSTNKSGVGYADYVLWGNNGLPLAVIEAKSTLKDANNGKHQAFLYANSLEKMFGQRPIIFYSNGFETYLWDDLFYPERQVYGFYTKSELEYLIAQRKSRTDIRNYNVNKDIAGRPYQLEAIKRVSEHLVTTHNGNLKGKQRAALLVMATGSGKTRTAAAITEMLTKTNWTKRILFLTDRIALVKQAKNAFNEHLPNLTSINLTDEKEDNSTRLVFSTYPTILNKIDNIKKGERFYGVGHFDVIIIDEAHRSVYQKYGAIFDYFDAILIGLTATPKNDIDHNTYGLFGIEDDHPTFAYELNQAVADNYLVPPKGITVPVKFVREGIVYKDLSEEDKKKFEEKFGDYGKESEDEDEAVIQKSAINKFLFNKRTVDIVLDFIMTNGIKVNAGDKIGKTIIFAKNHTHAVFIKERFNKNYPEYGSSFLEIIDNYESKAQDLLEKFCDDVKETEPQIAVSVDMMDTGVDAPRVVNLVFFKEVKSQTKYWQMIGRGTRLRPNLFAPGEDKTHFLIFDLCGNFEFFNDFPDGVQTIASKSLSQRIFETKLEIVMAIRNNTNANKEEDSIALDYINELHQIIANLDSARFEVRKSLELVIAFKERARWDNLSVGDVSDINNHLANLSTLKTDNDELAKRFDLLTLRLQLALLNGTRLQDNYIAQIFTIGQSLYKKRNIPAVAKKLPIINQIISQEFWKNVSVNQVEHIRVEIRELIKFIDRESLTPVYTDLDDELYVNEVKEVNIIDGYTNLQSYKDRVEAFIRKNKSHLIIDKLYKNIPITSKELNALETLVFNDDLGTKERYKKEYGNQPLGKFIRSILGLDITVVNGLFADFIQEENLNANQITFIKKIINYFNVHGTLEKELLIKPPFTELHDDGIMGLFPDSKVTKIVSLIQSVNGNAG